MEAIVELIPPVLASIAGIFPILFESLPEPLTKNNKPLTIILLVSGIWVIYILTLSFGYSYTLFSPAVTVITLVAGTSMLAILLGISLRQISLTPSWVSTLYILSIISLVSGFSNHLLMRDNIVLLATAGGECSSIEWVQIHDTNGNIFKLAYIDSIFGTGVVWPNDQFNIIKAINIKCLDLKEPKQIIREESMWRPWGAGKSYEF